MGTTPAATSSASTARPVRVIAPELIVRHLRSGRKRTRVGGGPSNHGMLAILLLAAGASTGVQPIVSMTWLQAHLNDASVRVIYVGDRDDYDRGHIPGARAIDHMDTVGGGHRLLPFADLARVLARAGAEDGAQVVLYGSDPMSTGWIYMAFAAVGHGGDVSWLDGGPRL